MKTLLTSIASVLRTVLRALGRLGAALGGVWNKLWRRIPFKLLCFAVLFAFPFLVRNQYLTYIAVTIMITSISVFGYNFMTGYAGTFILCSAAFNGIGAYAAVDLAMKLGVPIILSIFLGAAVSSVCGFLLSLPTQKLRATFLSLTTMAFNMMMFIVYKNLTPITGGAYGIKDIPRPVLFGHTMDNKLFYLFTLLIFIAMYILLSNILRSKTGRVMFAIGVDPTVAAAMGVNVGRYRTLIFCVAAFCCGLSGALSAFFINYIYANNFSADVTMMQLSMMALGGMASMAGSVIGPAIFTTVSLYFASLYNYRMFICGAMLILIMLYRPQGIAGGRPIGLRKKSAAFLREYHGRGPD